APAESTAGRTLIEVRPESARRARRAEQKEDLERSEWWSLSGNARTLNRPVVERKEQTQAPPRIRTVGV
ncbi:unnamed protein product, partial [Prorocentrum cordatum]